MTDGHRLLRRWLETNGTTQRKLARGVRRSDPTVCMWVSGANTPDISSAVAIAAYTRGAVPVESWARKARGVRAA